MTQFAPKLPTRKAVMRTLRGGTVLLALTALVSVGLVPTPAHAAIYNDNELGASGGYSNQSVVSCTPSSTSISPPQSLVPVENGPALTSTSSSGYRLTLDSDPTDFIDLASSMTARTQIKSAGGNPSTITLDVAGTVSASSSKPVSQCRGQVYSYGWLESDVSVTDPGWFLYDYRASRNNFAMIDIENENGLDMELENDIRAWNGAGRAFVPQGVYELYLEGDAWLDRASSTVAPTPVNVNLSLRYVKAGAALAKATGKAKSYVKFPRARTCDSSDVQLKTKGKASKASLIKLLVNGKTVRKIKNPKPNKKLNIQVAAGRDATVVTQVTLKPTKKGAKPVTVKSSGSYIACV